MIDVYVKLVQAGKRTLAEIPERYRDAVEALVKEGVE